MPHPLLYRDLAKTRSNSRKQYLKIILPTCLEEVRPVAGSRMLCIVINKVFLVVVADNGVIKLEGKAVGDQEFAALSWYGNRFVDLFV